MLSKAEKERLRRGILATLAIPFIDDIEDYVWEAIFAYGRAIQLVDPLSNIRRKLLFDVVDRSLGIGWSCKALQCLTITTGMRFELVIQRADIFSKAKQLGFSRLAPTSPPSELGNALLRHWQDEKVGKDARRQGVQEKRVAILLKNTERTRFAYYEDRLMECKPNEIEWRWTDNTRTGLQGRRRADDTCVYRWYPNQKQLFERFLLPKNAYVFTIKPRRLPAAEVVDLIATRLEGKP